jgi:hypothetical protein
VNRRNGESEITQIQKIDRVRAPRGRFLPLRSEFETIRSSSSMFT